MKDSENVYTFYNRVVGLINQLKSHGEAIEDGRVVEKKIRSLPPRFENLVVTLEEHTDMLKFTIDELQASLINHEFTESTEHRHHWKVHSQHSHT